MLGGRWGQWEQTVTRSRNGRIDTVLKGVSQWLLSRVHPVDKGGHRTALGAEGTVCTFSWTHNPAGQLAQGVTRPSPDSTGGPGRPGRRRMRKGLDFIPQGSGSHKWNLSKRDTCPETCFEKAVCFGKRQ